MNNIGFLLNDPVIWFAFGGLLTVLAICSFYVYFFMSKVSADS
ncbi:hypothetical protein QWY77_13675 [Thalassotalea ponticola]|nr:hypothetical protein [Thalassotalea ponticola]MDN3653790.1 hypothetical protein [Thalassotalea ponticola]